MSLITKVTTNGIFIVRRYVAVSIGNQFLTCKKEDVVKLPMRQHSTSDQLTHKLTIISHRTAFNDEQNPYHIVRYRRPRN